MLFAARLGGTSARARTRFGVCETPRSPHALSELATLYELDGAIRYRVLAYREAARVVRQSPVSVEDLARAGRATELPGVGKTLEQKIVTLLDTGEIPSAAKLKRKFPPSLVEVTMVPGVGAKTARRLYDELGVSSLEELRAAATEQRIRQLKGLGPKAEENVLAALGKLKDTGARRATAALRRCCRWPRSSRTTFAPIPPAMRSRSPARPGVEPRPATTST